MARSIILETNGDTADAYSYNGGTVLNENTPRYEQTRLKVLIVGAGIGGMVAALECWRKGHEVEIIERNQDMSQHGDIFIIGFSGKRWIENWPGMREEFDQMTNRDMFVSVSKAAGEYIAEPQLMTHRYVDQSNIGNGNGHGPWGDSHPVTSYSRPAFANMLFKQIKRLEIPITFGKRAVEYYEYKTIPKAGVVTEDGSRFEAEVVLAADGIGSISQDLLLSADQRSQQLPKSVFRAGYDIKFAMADAAVRARFACPVENNLLESFWIGPNSHIVVHTQPEMFAWAIVHNATGTEKESWNHAVDLSEVIAALEKNGNWSEEIYAMVKTAPPGSIRNWPLVLRSPSSSWTSAYGRILQIGDAAHPNLPSSAMGACAAIEDGVTIAACLQLAGKHRIGLATDVYSRLRHERVSTAQRMGVKNMQNWQHTDPGAIAENPSLVIPKQPQWILNHDPELYVYENFGKAANEVMGGPTFRNTNVPPGAEYQPWTAQEMVDKIRKGEQVEVTGDWS